MKKFLRSLWDRYLDLNPFYYLSTCALAEYLTRTKNLKWFTLGDFWFIKYTYTYVSWYCCLGLNNSLLVIVSKIGVYVIRSHSTSFMVLLPGIN